MGKYQFPILIFRFDSEACANQILFLMFVHKHAVWQVILLLITVKLFIDITPPGQMFDLGSSITFITIFIVAADLVLNWNKEHVLSYIASSMYFYCCFFWDNNLEVLGFTITFLPWLYLIVAVLGSILVGMHFLVDKEEEMFM